MAERRYRAVEALQQVAADFIVQLLVDHLRGAQKAIQPLPLVFTPWSEPVFTAPPILRVVTLGHQRKIAQLPEPLGDELVRLAKLARDLGQRHPCARCKDMKGGRALYRNDQPVRLINRFHLTVGQGEQILQAFAEIGFVKCDLQSPLRNQLRNCLHKCPFREVKSSVHRLEFGLRLRATVIDMVG